MPGFYEQPAPAETTTDEPTFDAADVTAQIYERMMTLEKRHRELRDENKRLRAMLWSLYTGEPFKEDRYAK